MQHLHHPLTSLHFHINVGSGHSNPTTTTYSTIQVLQPGALAAIISHAHTKPDGSPPEPRTWCFCPDPLCVGSRPSGSALPPAPAKIPLEAGVKITRSEYNAIQEVGLGVGAPVKAAAAAATTPTPA